MGPAQRRPGTRRSGLHPCGLPSCAQRRLLTPTMSSGDAGGAAAWRRLAITESFGGLLVPKGVPAGAQPGTNTLLTATTA